MGRVLRILPAIVLASALSAVRLAGQLSPGDLSAPHAHLGGLSNCTQCHVLGNRVANEKCLACHTEIQQRVSVRRGYHASPGVMDKTCSGCHSEHNGRDFRLVRFDEEGFDHNLTGYRLSARHAAEDCRSCHNNAHIDDPKLKLRKNTFLGLSPDCLSCHDDYHRQTLPAACLDCHSEEAFKPATGFDHSKARFSLAGKHLEVECSKCHRVEMINGSRFQQFRGLQFTNCNSCHADPHKNRFGQNCRQCHTESSFSTIKGVSSFDHTKTNFPLEGKHQSVDCRLCHKTKLTGSLKHDRCSDCHSDYHGGQFAREGLIPDCSECHTVNGFTQFMYTTDQHDRGVFPLNGSHEAVPCFECHRKQEKWSFRNIGRVCSDCHADVHKGLIKPEYYPGADCRVCHSEVRWTDVTFSHTATAFPLTGAHEATGCRLCHFREDQYGVVQQRFSGLPSGCAACHTDNHNRQFDVNGTTDCARCHTTASWAATGFNHNNAAFRLEGKHAGVACVKCHKVQKEGTVTYVQYKLKEFRCESCH